MDPDALEVPSWAADGLSVDERVAVRERAIDELTEVARGCAAAVSAAWVALVDAAAALEPLEGAYTATWRQWVAWQCGLTSGEAARVCTLAKRLPEQPGIEAAFRAGELSPAVVGLLLDVATPENEAALLETARIATGRQLEVLVRDFRRAQRDSKPSQDPELAPSEVSWGWKRGRFAGRFDCRPDHGALVEAALEDAYNKGRPDQDAVDSGDIADGELRDDEKPRTTRADAILALATSYLAGRENSKGMLPELTQITLHRNCRPDGTDPGARDPLFPTLLPGHGAIHDRLVALLECDATIVDQPMWCGHPSALPSRTRRFNRRQRRALAARDLTCRFPGCGRTRHLHAHHSVRATDGGPTDLINGVLLCPQHHALIHIHGHLILIEASGAVTIQRTDGTTLRGAPPPPPIGDQIPLPIATGERATGTGEHLTHWARDVITETWWNHTHHDDSDHPPDG